MAKQNSNIGKTYSTLKTTVVDGDPQALQTAVNQSSGTGSMILISGIFILVMVSSIIETGTFFGILLPSDLILSISVIVFISLKKRWLVLFITLISIAFTIVGDHLGYKAGRKLGSTLYDKPDTWYFKKKFFLDAQNSFIKRGDTMLYIGRYLSIGGFLPTLCGVMGMEQKKFTRLSILSAIMWKLSLVVPMTLIMLIFPGIKVGLLILLIFTLPEITGWIMLFMPKAQEYAEKLKGAKAQIDAIRADFAHIRSQVGDVLDILKQSTIHEVNSENKTLLSSGPSISFTTIAESITTPITRG